MNSTTKILHLTYDPETQTGLILRLRSRLGQHFELRFIPIEANGDEEEDDNDKETKKEPKKIPASFASLPAELVNYITMFLIKTNPTKDETKGLFSFAKTSKLTREFIESENLERATYKNVLGAYHSRGREERRLGLEPNVAHRYRGALKFLGLSAAELQITANENIEMYSQRSSMAYGPYITYELAKKNKLEEEEPQGISAWPWWYLRFLSNYNSLVSLTNPYTNHVSDLFSTSVLSTTVKWRPESVTKSGVSEATGGGNFSKLTYAARHPNKMGPPKWSTGADLMVIPLDILVLRGRDYINDLIKAGRTVIKPLKLNISIAEYSPNTSTSYPSSSVYYRKEVVMIGLEKNKLMKNLSFKIQLELHINQAFLGNSIINFLNHKQGARSYLRLMSLDLGNVYFNNPDQQLDLRSITGEYLKNLKFGPTNAHQVPKLSCPSISLEEIELWGSNPGRNDNEISFLKWDIPDDPNTCFPNITSLTLNGNIDIWKIDGMLDKLSLFPNLKIISLYKFYGTEKDLYRLVMILQQAQQSGTATGIRIIVKKSIISNRLKRLGGGVHFY